MVEVTATEQNIEKIMKIKMKTAKEISESERESCSVVFNFLQSLVAQLIKNLPAIQETWVQSMGWEDPLKKGKATHSSILAWRISWTV